MTNDRNLGSATAGKTSDSFNKNAPIDSPRGVLNVFENYLSGMNTPIPAGQVLSFIGQVTGSSDAAHSALDQNGRLMDHLKARLYDDGQLSREELVRTMAEGANQADTVKPDPGLVRQASAMLEKLGIKDDKNHSVAEGVAKTSVLTAVQIQSMEANMPGLKKVLQEQLVNPPLPVPVQSSESPITRMSAPVPPR